MRDKLIELLRSVPITDKTYAEYTTAVADKLIQADVVEVVRCKDCAWYNTTNECCGNMRGIILTTPNSFCNQGERRENGK